MKSFLTKNAKLIYFIYGVLLAAVLISALFFMTQYRHIRVNYDLKWGEVLFSDSSSMNKTNQIYLYDFFYSNNVGGYTGNFNKYARIVFDFKNSLDAFNDLIVTFSIIGLICFAGLLICANHSRKVYYKSNLILGIVFPLVVIVFGIVMIVKDIMLISEFEENSILYNLVSVLQNPANKLAARGDAEGVIALFDCDNTTFVLYIVIFALVIIYSVFLVIYAWFRYSNCAEKRKSILEKAGTVQC